MAVTALLVAAGRGERLGAAGRPKAFVALAGRPMLEWSLDALRAAGIERIVVALPEGEAAPDGCTGVLGGRTRSVSVRNALAAAGDAEQVVVHDAARPLVTAEHFTRALAALAGADCAIAAAPMTDTVKEAGPDHRVTATLDRSRLWAVQTPQAFRREALERALAAPEELLAQATDDAWLVERAGGTVLVVESTPANLKVTTAARPRGGRAAAARAMLTDYHVHLRPDGDEETAERYFTPANAERYRTVASERGIAELGVAEHVHRFTAALDVWEHPLWRKWAHDDIDAYCEFVREQTDLKLGIEADFVAGREDRMANLLEAREWDYVVGSVHFLQNHAVDADVFSVWGTGESADKVWRRYFETVAESARCGLYDVIAHPDLVKVWGDRAPRPDGDLRRYYEPAVEAFADSGVAVEVSTAGLRKPVGELYPAAALLEMVVDAGCPIALSSDAHVPDQLGYRYEDALEALEAVGVRELAVFERRARRMEPIG